jgi:hypothetical protein
MPKSRNRSHTRPRVALTLVIAILATMTAATTAFAASPSSNYGSSVACAYRTHSPGPTYTARLKTITVTPPRMFADSGQQTVGWRFMVRRTIEANHEREYPSHRVTYRSAIETAMATTTTAAAFEQMTVDVALPRDVDPRDIYYQVVIRMLRYRADGTVKSSVSYLMPEYTVRVKGDGWAWTEHGAEICPGAQWAAV